MQLRVSQQLGVVVAGDVQAGEAAQRLGKRGGRQRARLQQGSRAGTPVGRFGCDPQPGQCRPFASDRRLTGGQQVHTQELPAVEGSGRQAGWLATRGSP